MQRVLIPLVSLLLLGLPALPSAQVRAEVLLTGDIFDYGNGVAGLGDLDGDGISEAVGAQTLGGIFAEGEFTIFFLNADGTEKSRTKTLGFQLATPPTLESMFGESLGSPGDLDGDGIPELLAGARLYFNGTKTTGAVWTIFLNPDGTVKQSVHISEGAGGFQGALEDLDFFGVALAPLGDVDGDGVPDVAVGATGDDDGGPEMGAVWILFLKPDGSVKAEQKISATAGGFTGALTRNFGNDVAGLGDVDGNGVPDLAVGEQGAGAVWILLLNSDGTVLAHNKIAGGEGGFTGWLEQGHLFGLALAPAGDRDGNGVPDLVVGDHADSTGGPGRGAIWTLFLDPAGNVLGHDKVASGLGGLASSLVDFAEFGIAADAIGDLDGNGSIDLLVGARGLDSMFVLFTELGLHASAIPYRGTGVNDDCFASATQPRIGANWVATVDSSGHPGALTASLHARGARLDPPLLIPAGEILVDVFSSPLLFELSGFATSSIPSTFFVPVPNDVGLIGFPLTIQASLLGNGASTCNAIDVVLGV